MRLRVVFGLFVVAVVAASAVSAAVAKPPPGKGGGGGHDSAVGGFRGQDGLNNVGFSARSDANGANARGHLSQTIPPSAQFPQGRKDRFRVTCLAVTGNHAAIGLMPTDARTRQNFPNGRVLVVLDNGNPVGGHPVDKYNYFAGTDDCTLYTTFVPAASPVSGNISVHDAP